LGGGGDTSGIEDAREDNVEANENKEVSDISEGGIASDISETNDDIEYLDDGREENIEIQEDGNSENIKVIEIQE